MESLKRVGWIVGSSWVLLGMAAVQAPAQNYPDWWTLLPKPKVNNVWYARNPKSDAVVVFIHGIFSDSQSAWLYRHPKDPAQHMYWPHLVCRDPNLQQPSVYLAGFYTAIDSGNYDMKQA